MNISTESANPTALGRFTSRVRDHFLELLSIAIVWIISRPYSGIVHDSILYVISAEVGQDEAHLARDLYISSESQSRFTIFTPLLRILGVQRAPGMVALVVTAIGLVLWVVLLVRILFALELPVAIAIVVAVTSSYYGGFQVFRFAESFATPRLMAEALVLGSIAFTLDEGRLRTIGLFLTGALLLHPLVGGTGLLFVIACQLLTRGWRAQSVALLGGTCGVAVSAAIAATQGPAESAWMVHVVDRSPFLLPSEWMVGDWATAVISLTLVVVGVTRVETRRLAGPALATGVAGIVAWAPLQLFGTPMMVAQLQPWRTMWLVQVGAGVVLGAEIMSGGPRLRVFAGWIGVVAGLAVVLAPQSAFVAVVGVVAVWVASLVGQGRLRVNVIAFAVGFAAMGLGAVILLTSQAGFSALLRHEAIKVGTSLIGAVVLLVLLARRDRFPSSSMIAIVLCGALIVLGSTWDERSAWQRWMEVTEDRPGMDALPEAARVLTDLEGYGAWAYFRQPAWFARPYGAPGAFSAQFATTYENRRRLVDAAGFDSGSPALFFRPFEAEPSRAEVTPAIVCEAKDRPNVILSRKPPDSGSFRVVTAPIELSPQFDLEEIEDLELYLTRCDDVASYD